MGVVCLRQIYQKFNTLSRLKKRYIDMLQNYGQIVCDYCDGFSFEDYGFNARYVLYPTYHDVRNFVTNLGFTTNYEKNKKEIIIAIIESPKCIKRI